MALINSKRLLDLFKMIIIAIAVHSVFFLFLVFSVAPNENHTVYITDTGDCYHSFSCSSLRYSKYRKSLSDAVNAGYYSCENCDPPELIPEGRNVQIPWWAYIVLPPVLATVLWNVSIFIIPIFRIDLDNIKLGHAFLVFIIIALFFMILFDSFL